MKKNFFILGIIMLIIGIFLIIYPLIEFNIGNKIIKFSYNEDVSEFEENACYDENYFYNEERDISIYNFDFKKILVFHIIILEYKEGNVCDTEYVLDEEYIDDFLDRAVIKENVNNIDLAKLIEGKKAIVGNIRYFGNDYSNSVEYILDGKEELLYVFYIDNLLVIQVGSSDEGPKYIAYK